MDQVFLCDVGPRDGLQNQATLLSVQQRLQLVDGLLQAGVPLVEAGAMVSPKAVPAMAGSDELLLALADVKSRLQVLIPNARGYQLARDAGAENVVAVICASNTMNQKNVRMDTLDSLTQISQIQQQALADKVRLQACIAVAWECPFEGRTPIAAVMSLAAQLYECGIRHINIADTIGAANPKAVKDLMQPLVRGFYDVTFTCHFHDTRAMGLANAFAAYEAGVKHFDASVGGLGGCPFAPGATGNVASEDLVMMFEQMGVSTGIDLEQLMVVGQLAGDFTEQPTGGRAHKWRMLQLEKGRTLC